MKKRRLTIILLTLLSVAFMTACSPELDFVLEAFEAPKAEVSGNSESPRILFSSDEGQATVVFHCNRRWNASFVNERAVNWCSISGTEGRSGTVTLTVRVRANAEYDERSASILFTCDDVTRTLVVTQKQKDALFLGSNRIEMPSEGGSFMMSYRTNIASQVSVEPAAAEWIIPSKTKGLATYTETFNVKANESLEPRQGTVEVSSALGKEVLTVYQAGERPTLVLGAHEVNIPASGGDFAVQVTSNLDVSVSFHNGKWLHEVETKTLSTNTYYFSADRNDSRQGRQDMLVFRDKSRGIADSVRIRQAFQPILASTDPVFVPGSGSVRFSLSTANNEPSAYKFAISGSWISLYSVEQKGEACIILLETRPNRTAKQREDVIQVYYEGYSQPDEVKVTQAALEPFFSYTTTRQEVKAPSFAQSGEGFILWGDGSYDWFERFAGIDKNIVHAYADGMPSHTIVVESGSVLWLQVPEPEDGMHFDFSTLKKKE